MAGVRLEREKVQREGLDTSKEQWQNDRGQALDLSTSLHHLAFYSSCVRTTTFLVAFPLSSSWMP